MKSNKCKIVFSALKLWVNRHIKNISNVISFTLIELLVVIAIISILMTMLLPALKKAKSVTQRSACINNTRQIHFSVLNYIGDYNGYMYGHNTTPDNGMYFRWITSDAKGGKYIDTGGDFIDSNRPGGNILDCPVQNNAGDYCMDRYPAACGKDLLSECINLYLTGMKKKPSQEVMVMDSYNTMLRKDSWQLYEAVHDGGNIVGFYDGHAKWVSGLLIQGYDHYDYFWYRYE